MGGWRFGATNDGCKVTLSHTMNLVLALKAPSGGSACWAHEYSPSQGPKLPRPPLLATQPTVLRLSIGARSSAEPHSPFALDQHVPTRLEGELGP